MDPDFWAKAHGASTHLPLALAMCSWGFDAVGFGLSAWPAARQLNVAGYWTMIVGALGTVPAVVSGLMLTKGEMLGHDVLLFHHLFVWPAYALLVGLATWRAYVGVTASRRAFAGYLTVAFVAAGLLAGAGYWGGELLLGGA
jgi:uncharacterized membrane protein